MFNKFLEELEKAQIKQEKHKKNPDSPEAKAHARKAGFTLLILGCILLLAAAAEWIYLDMIHFFLPVAGVVMMGFGLHIALTGKMKR